eukprot:CAMPEP_0202725888 /NCGR_PEP_ID=MMETSP1385-20130828/184330_1 /ASSEMBLY_ACC=CAM_ASM_000861 /TAXON_ID=933848 /ORGANISM="Elphidium margaritaceum" /LENGTH=910 /DNA_ID=CAMNT_0049392093 /DNA_START=346 /DNA_END=3078 /DNA_ORIENTATION=-
MPGFWSSLTNTEDKEAKAAREAAEAARSHEAELQRLREAEAQKDRAYKLEVLKLEKAAEKEKQANEAKAAKELQDAKIKHEAEQAQLQKEREDALFKFAKDDVAQQKGQRDAQVKELQACIDAAENRKKKNQQSLKETGVKLDENKNMSQTLDLEIKGFNLEEKLMTLKSDMDTAKKLHDQGEDDIAKAIADTGQTEGNVCKFLRLTQALIGGTTTAQSQTNALDARIAVFYSIIARECRERLLIKDYFDVRGLNRFTPILAKHKMIDCEDLVCEDESEFKEDVFSLLEVSVNKDVEQWNEKHPSDPVVRMRSANKLEAFLKDCRIEKFADALEECDVTELEDVADLDDDSIEDIIKTSGQKVFACKKFKKAVQQYKDGKYKPPPEAEQKENETTAVATTDKAGAVATTDKAGALVRPAFISSRDRKDLLKICTRPDTWKALQTEKTMVVRSGMQAMSPLMAEFFLHMYDAVTMSQKLLTYNGSDPESLNEEQQKAIKMLESAEQLPPSSDDDDAKQEEKEENTQDEQADEDPTTLPDYVQRKAWSKDDACQVFSDSAKKWCDGKIVDISATDADGKSISATDIDVNGKLTSNPDVKIIQYLHVSFGADGQKKRVLRYGDDVRYPLSVATRAIKAAVIVNTSVVDVMRPLFELSAATRVALPIAISIESSCRQVLESRVHMQDCLRLVNQLLSLKPPKMSDPLRKALWAAVDDGIVHIITNALEMAKISEKYFGFFLRFNQSFQKYVAITQDEQTKNVSLFTALQNVRQDVSEFGQFKSEFEATVKRLNGKCLAVIKNCVKEQKGADHLTQVFETREQLKTDYLAAKALYDKERYTQELALLQLKKDKIESVTALARETLRQTQLKESIKQDEADMKIFTDAQTKLRQMVFDQNVEAVIAAKNSDPQEKK